LEREENKKFLVILVDHPSAEQGLTLVIGWDAEISLVV